VDNNGQAVLYVDGVRDLTDFTYTKTDQPFDRTTIGGILRAAPSHWFTGSIDDVRVYDHALSEFEVQALIPEPPGSPAAGDTHCGSVSVTGPPGNLVGTYTATALGAVDDSGDPIRYLFEAESDTGALLRVGPQSEASADFDLGRWTWTISVTVDDDPACSDLAPDAKCSAAPIVVSCFAAGDTHCSTIDVVGPSDESPGIYMVTSVGAIDDSGDAISYIFRADNGAGIVLNAGPQLLETASFFLGVGIWTISVTVDDDADCTDVAPDAVCTTTVEIACPTEGDTHCDDLVVAGPPESTPGTYTATVLSGSDDSGDVIQYTFRAETPEGKVVQVGPQTANTADLVLSAGTWTVRAFTDDNTACFDVAPDAVCETEVVVEGDPPGLLSHWKFDGDTFDSADNFNDGVFQGGLEVDPVFVEGYDGLPEGAIQLDGIDDCVAITQNRNLPLHAHEAFTIALWVRGGPQPDFRVWSEGSSLTNAPLFTMGTDATGVTGQVDIYVRTGANQVLVNHRRTLRDAFNGDWHHVAFTRDEGKAVLYVDGIRDATDFSYEGPGLAFDRTSIGCVLRAAASHFFAGAIDDVRVYNYALDEGEVLALVPAPSGCPAAGDTHCGDLAVVGPGGGAAGVYTATATGATDDSGDAVIYTFTAEDTSGAYMQRGPQAEDTAVFNLFPGDWTVRVTVDDDLACRDRAANATCSRAVTVAGGPRIFLSHWELDGDVLDSQPAGNHGTFAGAPDATFGPDRDGTPSSALQLDGMDDYVLVSRQSGLPLYDNHEFSVAMWVNGLPQPDRRVWSESSSENNAPLFNIGTHNGGASGQVDIFVRDASGAVVLAHALSAGIAFDGTWHHIAWVDSGGNAALYIDGVKDPMIFNYVRPAMPFNLTTVGGILRGASCCWFNGSIDDVRAYSYALSREEVEELAGKASLPRFHRGDADDNGSLQLTDAVAILGYLFLGSSAPGCLETADADDDGSVSLTDAIRILGYLFLGGPPPAPPGPPTFDCGTDPAGSVDVGCDSYLSC
ncbi:MAG TPA: LamG-like jellyroll fold domain-containing protein, partial [Planctomycetota bacterium]|nr:LamG-like jellyroll fold domain-containing protein [Planctomycetota bacterium]